MARNPDNVKKLRAEGVIKRGLPAPYLKVFEKLTPQEMKVILEVKERLDKVKTAHRGVEDYEFHVGF